jgi:hypothetical protein
MEAAFHPSGEEEKLKGEDTSSLSKNSATRVLFSAKDI